MHALFLAMILTGAGGMAEAQGGAGPMPAPSGTPPAPVFDPRPPAPRPSPPPAPRPPLLRASFADYFTRMDYPAGALPLGGQADVIFRVDVGTDGRVTTCEVLGSSGSPGLDQATCRVLRQHARFRPLPDADGRPTAGRNGGRIRWMAPARTGDTARIQAPFPPPQRARANLNSWFSPDDYPAAALRANAQGVTSVSMTVGRDGRVAACSVISSSGSAALDEATCRILTSRARYNPTRDASGNPARGQDYGRIIWRLPAG